MKKDVSDIKIHRSYALFFTNESKMTVFSELIDY